MRGIQVHIFRSDLGDCTNKGVTSPERAQGKTFVVFDEALPQGNWSLEECQNDPRFVCLKIVRRWVGQPNEYLHLEPMRPPGGGNSMAGGNYVGSSDSRFRELSRYPLPVHDRFETAEQSAALSQ